MEYVLDDSKNSYHSYIGSNILSLTWDQQKNRKNTEVSFSGIPLFWTHGDLIGLKDQEGQYRGLFIVNSEDYEKLELIYTDPHYLIHNKDSLSVINLQKANRSFFGSTLLWRYKSFKRKDSARFMPLFTQGSLIGDTAQTLIASEWFLNTLGTLAYGWKNWISLSTNIPALTFGSPNLRIKAKAYDNHNQTWALGFSLAQEKSSDEKLMNIDFMWDSVLSENLVAHSILSAAVITFDEAKSVAALKSYGSSSIQTGYEYIMKDWGRILAGPSYNIEQEAIGGYFSYIKIYDGIFLQFSLTSNNIRNMRLSAEEGYLAYIEASWRW